MSYNHLQTIEDPEDGDITASVTERGKVPGGKRFTFNLRRDYATDSGIKQTGWFTRKHIAAIRRVLDKVEGELILREEVDKAERKALLQKARA